MKIKSIVMRRSASLVLGLGVLVAALNTHAQTTNNSSTLDFESLPTSPFGTQMPTNYCGFRWYPSNWHHMTQAGAATNNYLALSGATTWVFGSTGGKFYFDGADFWSRRGLDANGLFYFILYSNAVVVYDGRDEKDGKMRFTAEHQFFSPNYSGLVDGVAMVFTQGGDDWDHLAMDNFKFHGVQAAQPPAQLSVAPSAGGRTVVFTGTPGQPYVIQASTNLNGDWGQLGVVTADAGGVVNFADTANLPQRFYRAVAP